MPVFVPEDEKPALWRGRMTLFSLTFAAGACIIEKYRGRKLPQKQTGGQNT
jgi:hypothetical protein